MGSNECCRLRRLLHRITERQAAERQHKSYHAMSLKSLESSLRRDERIDEASLIEKEIVVISRQICTSSNYDFKRVNFKTCAMAFSLSSHARTLRRLHRTTVGYRVASEAVWLLIQGRDWGSGPCITEERALARALYEQGLCILELKDAKSHTSFFEAWEISLGVVGKAQKDYAAFPNSGRVYLDCALNDCSEVLRAWGRVQEADDMRYESIELGYTPVVADTDLVDPLREWDEIVGLTPRKLQHRT